MKYFLLGVSFLLMLFVSCTKQAKEGDWDDIIKLSKKSVDFNADGDSVTIKTGGDWWWVTQISINETHFYHFPEVGPESENSQIICEDLLVERRDKNTLFIKSAENHHNMKRTIIVELEAGDYFDSVTITQKE